MKKTSKPNEPQNKMPSDISSSTPAPDASSPDTSSPETFSIDSSEDYSPETSMDYAPESLSAHSSADTSIEISPEISPLSPEILTDNDAGNLSPDASMVDSVMSHKKDPPFPLVDPVRVSSHKPAHRFPFIRKIHARHLLISLLSLFLISVIVISIYIWRLLDQPTHVVVPIVTGGGEVSEGLLDDVSLPDETVEPIGSNSAASGTGNAAPYVESSWGSGRVRLFVDARFPITYVEQKDPNVENILLIGVDSRSAYERQSRTDSILLVSVDKNNNIIKMTSFMRDTQVKIPGKTSPTKINEAYSYGGIGLLVNTMNINFDLDIQKFAMVDMSSAENVINAAGGVTINVMKNELSDLNLNLYESNSMFRLFSTPSPALTFSGVQLLDGRQAVAYGRIRYIGSDTARTQRQRTVLSALIVSFKSAPASNKMKFFDAAFQSFETSMTKTDMFFLAFDVLAGMRNIQQYRVPQDDMYSTNLTNYQLVINYALQLPSLHKFIWGNTSGLTISMPDAPSEPVSSESSSMDSSSTSEGSYSESSSDGSSSKESSTFSDSSGSSETSSSDSVSSSS